MLHRSSIGLRATNLARRFACCGGIVALAGCGSDVVAPKPAPDPTQLYWALTFDRHAVTLSTFSPYDTVRLIATPRNGLGAPLPGAPAVTFTSSDLEHVRVDADGLVHALAPGKNIAVIATLTAGSLTHADTAVIDVTSDSTPPMLATFSIHPTPPDSAISPMLTPGAFVAYFLYGPAVAGLKQLSVQALDSAGAPVPDLTVDFRSSDTTIATVDRLTGMLTGVRPGRVTIVASATVYGVAKADTLPYTITLPAAQGVDFGPSGTASAVIGFSPSGVTIVAGGFVMWLNTSKHPVDVVFDDSAEVFEDSVACQCGAGNIAAFGDTTGSLSPTNLRTRRFPTPGTYTYRSVLTGATGTITVASPPAESRHASRAAVASVTQGGRFAGAFLRRQP